MFGELWGKTYLEQAHHLSKHDAAGVVSALFLGWAVGSPLAGYVSDKTGKRLFILAVGAIGSLICVCPVLYLPNLPLSWLTALIFLYGVFSGTEITAFITAREYCDSHLSSTVFAAINMIVSLTGFFLQPSVGMLLDTFGQSELIHGERVYTAISYQVGLSVLPASLILMLLCVFGLRQYDRRKLARV